MKKYLALLLLSTMLFSSCLSYSSGTTSKVVPPQNKLIPIAGKWTAFDYNIIDATAFSSKDMEEWVGKIAQFNDDIGVFDEDICMNPSYKVKNVYLKDYLANEYNLKENILDENVDKVQIVTVTSKDRFFYEFIKYTDDKMAVYIDGAFILLKKVSDDIDVDYNKKVVDNYKKKMGVKSDHGKLLKSGILIGLRYDDKTNNKDGIPNYKYRTLWVSANNKEFNSVYEINNIFLPRKSGFWMVGTKNTENNNLKAQSIYSYPVDKETKIMNKNNKINASNTYNSSRTILCVGNDYVSTEYKEYEMNKNGGTDIKKAVYEVLPIDDVENAKAVKISDIAGENGKKVLMDEAGVFRTSLNKDRKSNIDTVPLEENFAIVRRNGHWVMVGRLNFIDGSSYEDFNIRYVPPSRLINYDELSIPWNSIKAKVPDVIDAYTSPNKDIAVVITDSTILLYTINNNELSDRPQKKIKLKQGESVVMAEWATGGYVEKWDKSLLKNKPHEISE